MDTVLPGQLHLAPDLPEALDIVRRNQGVFGTGTPKELLRVLEWFVDPSCVLVLEDLPGGKLSDTDGCVCVGDSFQFVGRVVEPSLPKQIGLLRYDVDLTPGDERVHLDVYVKREHPPDPPMSMKPHLDRAYRAMERAGIGTLELEAGLDSEPTFWAHAGVKFRAGQALLSHLEVLAMLLVGETTPPTFTSPEDVRTGFHGSTASIEDGYDASVWLSQYSSTPTWVAANHLTFMRNQLGLPIDVQRPVGEAILFAISPWEGRVDLSDPGTSDAEYRAFLGI